ncbi:relaxase/mobilization nuclease domain-containing protein [Ruegeria marina]|uniref:Relaxase/Mobilisation nuclease domain-containing protein n=1 Tax=Ruegeria marina TaxID=639004 RepID=A0A1G7DAM0_9RHOB|nr:relaxase/mobilization nuclease domain-containing protein [Ruegeria marina]SDE47956.1 Relaxase/Mobilisation nuclease domain-containing protein [Ruegeria marina]
MIPFATSRGLGQDLATHLQNAQENERVEVAQIRGAACRDLHGAFAEWEFQADALTRCQKYLYSLSVNPDPAQGRLTREQYLDYIDRAEEQLGLAGQPRAVVFHIKHGREHCHVVWSRIDAQQGKAVHLAYDKQKLMMVTREFAREHGLSLPKGYERGTESGRQATLYEMHQQRETGISKQDRIDQITAAWRTADSPKAFVGALADQGYILATGNRPYLVVDLYGHVSALPRMIGDKQVRAKDVQAFLQDAYPVDALPSVDEAKELAAKHRAALKEHEKVEDRAAQISALEQRQAERRAEFEKQKAVLREKQDKERSALVLKQQAVQAQRRAEYVMEGRRIRERRRRGRATGLAAFLGRVTGVSAAIKLLHKRQDTKRYQAYRTGKDALIDLQREERVLLERKLQAQAMGISRKLRGLDKVEKRELASLETSLVRQGREQARGGRTEMPSLRMGERPGENLTLEKREQERSRWAENAKDITAAPEKTGPIDLTEEFDRAAGVEAARDDEGRGQAGDGRRPRTEEKAEEQIKRYRRKRSRDRGKDRGR